MLKICKILPNWNSSSIINNLIEKIKIDINASSRVVLGLSGGVDSLVVAHLLRKAIGDKLNCIFINNGLLRLNEVKEIEKNFNKDFNFIKVDQSQEFLKALHGISDPEQKRKIIGNLFIKSFEKAATTIGKITHLAQGTIYPDIVESLVIGKKGNTIIKSHHNVGGLPKNLNLKLIEPLKSFFKDEVRKIGEELGISKKMLYRHPFPGPGLGIRIIGEITKKKCDMLRKADDIFIKILKNEGYYYKIWQAYAALLPVKTVGVMGDNRTHELICLLRAVSSVDGMTADYFKIPYEILSKISINIINKVPGINRVVYDITSKPPGTIELE